MPLTSSFGDRYFNLGNGMYEKLKAVLSYVCDGLFSIGEDGFRTIGMASIWKLPVRY